MRSEANGIDPDEWRSMSEQISEIAEAFRRVDATINETFRLIARELQGQQDAEIDEQVEGFQRTLSNMTDSQIWREIGDGYGTDSS